MTKTVIEMWHKVWPDAGAFVRASAQDLERFAELVRADEREACAKECDEEASMRTYAGNTHPEESCSRSRCFAGARAAQNCAAAIRARGNT